MKIVVRDIGRKLISAEFDPASQPWSQQNPPAEFCITSIENIPCFVKRQPRLSSGWGLILKAVGERQINNAPRIISVARDDGFYYYFTEKLFGATLHDYLKAQSGNKLALIPKVITKDLLRSLISISKSGYWYADLCKKNIYILSSGSARLIDLDSCVAHARCYESTIKVSNEYPPLLRKFAKTVSGKKLGEIPGECMNQAESVAFAIDSLNEFSIASEFKIRVIHDILMRDHQIEYKNLFMQLVNGESNWNLVCELIEKIFRKGR